MLGTYSCTPSIILICPVLSVSGLIARSGTVGNVFSVVRAVMCSLNKAGPSGQSCLTLDSTGRTNFRPTESSAVTLECKRLIIFFVLIYSPS